MDWPHFFVYRGSSRSPAKYDELTVPEFFMGYTRIVTKSDAATATLMLSHLHYMMSDTAEFAWASVRNYHAIVLQQFELGHLTWTDEASIQMLRCRYAQKPNIHVTATARGPQFCLSARPRG